jgi:hypothetical protein
MRTARHLKEFHGLPVADFPSLASLPGSGGVPEGLPAAEAAAWRISSDTYDSEESWPAAFARFAATVDLTRVRALVVGAWEEAYDSGPEPVIEALLAARSSLPALRALFIGDMEMEECEISWIHQGDVTRLLEGFGELAEFGVRGGTELVFRPVAHRRLRSLTVETGGMPAEAVRGVAAGDFPALERLTLWLGTANYGGDCEISDVAPILEGSRLPALRHLGLCNSDLQDEIAAAVAAAPVMARLETLDLSMGVLSDEGAAALLGGQPLTHLRELDLHHNYLSEPICQRLRETLEPAGVTLDLNQGDAEEDDWDGEVHRYVAVGE